MKPILFNFYNFFRVELKLIYNYYYNEKSEHTSTLGKTNQLILDKSVVVSISHPYHLEIPEFKLKRRVLISTKTDKNGDEMLLVQGRDIDGLPFSFFKEVM